MKLKKGNYKVENESQYNEIKEYLSKHIGSIGNMSYVKYYGNTPYCIGVVSATYCDVWMADIEEAMPYSEWKELIKPTTYKRGETVLVRDEDDKWESAILYSDYTEGVDYPVCISKGCSFEDEEDVSLRVFKCIDKMPTTPKRTTVKELVDFVNLHSDISKKNIELIEEVIHGIKITLSDETIEKINKILKD